MADTEVTVSMGDVVMVKATDDLDDPSKTQVILQLQPITPGMEEESGEVDIVAIGAHSEETTVEGEEVELGYPITCGESKAVLLIKKFVCPGINVKCVKYEDQLISPKQFVHMSGKATLKDWKRAIRMGGVMLRKMMDSGQLDFYDHSTLCTNTCRSTKFDLLINNARFPPDGTGLTTPTSSQAQIVIGNGGQVAIGEDRADVLEWSSAAVTLETAEKKETSEISEETLNFWKGIADVGLMGEVVTNISTELLEMLKGVQLRGEQGAIQDADSCLVEVAVLSNLAQVFGLLDNVKNILERRRLQTDPGQEQVLNALASLDQQLEEQRKQQQARVLLSNPPPVNNVGQAPAKRQAKRPRLQRPASSAALLTSALAQQAALQPQQFTVLSPITISSVGQPFATMAGLPIATLAQPSNTVTLHAIPANTQLFTRYMVGGGADGKTDTFTLHPSSGLTLVGAAVQDPGQLGAMVGPVELVQLAQRAACGEGEVLGGAVLVQEAGSEADECQGHTVIEIDPAPGEQAMGVMELQLAGGEDGAGGDGTAVVVQGGMEMAMVADGEGEVVQGESEETPGHVEVQTAVVQGAGLRGLQLGAPGQLSGLRIVVIEESSQVEDEA